MKAYLVITTLSEIGTSYTIIHKIEGVYLKESTAITTALNVNNNNSNNIELNTHVETIELQTY